MKYAYYPGCSLESSAKEYDLSIRACCQYTGVELIEVPDWICCGASSAHATSHLLSIALPAKTLVQTEKMGLHQIIAPCIACLTRLKVADMEMEEKEDLKKDVETVLESSYKGSVRVRNVLDVFLNDVGLDKIEKTVTTPLKGLKVACYYGCLLTRPPHIAQFDDVENPHSMDDLMRAIGAETVDWSFKTDCCGVSMSLAETDTALVLTNKILEGAKDAGADCVAVACPLCQSNLDLRQKAIGNKFGVFYDLPILYFSQLMGLAFGATTMDVGLEKVIVDPFPVLGAI